MGQPLALPTSLTLDSLLRQQWGNCWLIGSHAEAFWPCLEQMANLLQSHSQIHRLAPKPAVLVAEPDPISYLATVVSAHWQGYTVVLANPQWGQREWTQVQALAQPNLSQPLADGSNTYFCLGIQTSLDPEILMATGGTAGQVKFVRHTWATLMGSVQGFQAHFGIAVINAYCVLPLHHVSGLMQGLRVLASGGKLAIQAYSDLKQGQILDLPAERFLSLVPTQLQWLLAQEAFFVPWLKSFRAVLLGGAPAWPALLEKARSLHIPLALTYGMTETASQIATLLPEEFLAGNSSSGRVLPHANILVLANQSRQRLSMQPKGRTGVLAIKAESLFKGYLMPSAGSATCPPLEGAFLSDDVGYLDDKGYLHLLGRQSTKIITGGENVFPEEIEAALLVTDWVQRACVVGVPDAKWGQAVCALIVSSSKVGTLGVLAWHLKSQLAPHKQPKHWILLSDLPLNAQGKINRSAAVAWARAILGQPPGEQEKASSLPSIAPLGS
jgi:O-succinylbenzoic acid--CoA ligase